ncbi:hypothetical protein PAMP_007781 [Pampus punctatissimus]
MLGAACQTHATFMLVGCEEKQRQLCLSSAEVTDRRSAPFAPADITSSSFGAHQGDYRLISQVSASGACLELQKASELHACSSSTPAAAASVPELRTPLPGLHKDSTSPSDLTCLEEDMPATEEEKEEWSCRGTSIPVLLHSFFHMDPGLRDVFLQNAVFRKCPSFARLMSDAILMESSTRTTTFAKEQNATFDDFSIF